MHRVAGQRSPALARGCRVLLRADHDPLGALSKKTNDPAYLVSLPLTTFFGLLRLRLIKLLKLAGELLYFITQPKQLGLTLLEHLEGAVGICVILSGRLVCT